MIILLEGADCTGKSTLAETFKIALGNRINYEHNTQNTNSRAHFAMQLDVAKKYSLHHGVTIIDRQWISEAIYGHIMRGESNDPEGTTLIVNNIARIITVVCVREDKNKHLQHFRQIAEERDEYAKDKIEKVIEAYHDLWYGNYKCKFPGLIGLFSRYNPMHNWRNCIQYDMDRRDPERFVSSFLKVQYER